MLRISLTKLMATALMLFEKAQFSATDKSFCCLLESCFSLSQSLTML